jgi:hypothetical protein
MNAVPHGCEGSHVMTSDQPRGVASYRCRKNATAAAGVAKLRCLSCLLGGSSTTPSERAHDPKAQPFSFSMIVMLIPRMSGIASGARVRALGAIPVLSGFGRGVKTGGAD